ncbi:MAG: ABC transporter ATP-binding protein [Planctomycetaceae bacterium]|nr:ABC transporter ATP-binding protein [Planctomycetaceae bacterium]
MSQTIAPTLKQPAIQINRLTRYFGPTRAVNQLSFSVMPGEVVGFIGPNGAGKTTTMRILSTLDEPDEGDAYVDGFSVINDPDQVRFRLGFVPDAYGAYPAVTCIEYLDFFARSYGLKGRQRIEAIEHVLDFTHMHHMTDKPMNGLSKGMKQRLCLGRALIHDPTVLILDEPAAGLDPRARIELKEMIVDLAKQGKSLLISSHILSELAEMCDRVAIIERGELLASGTVDEILRKSTGLVEDHHANLVSVAVEVTGDPNVAATWLQEQSVAQAIQNKNGIVEFLFEDLAEARQQLLRRMVDAGLPVCSFSVKRRSLEEVFMNVTRGNVQ